MTPRSPDPTGGKFDFNRPSTASQNQAAERDRAFYAFPEIEGQSQRKDDVWVHLLLRDGVVLCRFVLARFYVAVNMTGLVGRTKGSSRGQACKCSGAVGTMLDKQMVCVVD